MIERLEQWTRWPLWSWRNLTVTVVAVLILFTGLGRLANGEPSASKGPASGGRAVAPTGESTVAAPTAPVPSPSTATTAPTTQPSTRGVTSNGSPSTTAAPTPVAVEFTRAWTRTTVDQAAWLAALKPFVTSDYFSVLSTVDPARVPASRVVDAGRELSSSGERATVQVGTDGGTMAVTLVLRDRVWLVSDIEPTNLPPGAPTPSLTPGSTATG